MAMLNTSKRKIHPEYLYLEEHEKQLQDTHLLVVSNVDEWLAMYMID